MNQKAILYARFSPRPDEETSDSCTKQLADLREWCAGRDYKIVGEFHDDAMSGGSDDRPDLANAIEALRRGYYLACRSIDRLSRDNFHTEAYLMAIAKRGAYLVTMDGVSAADETAEQEFVRVIFQGLAQYQRRKIRETTSRRMKQHQRNGRRMSAKLLYGYRDAGSQTVQVRVGVKTLDVLQRLTEPDPAEQQVITRIQELRGQDLSLREIAAALESEGILCRGRTWHPSTIMKILDREQPASA